MRGAVLGLALLVAGTVLGCSDIRLTSGNEQPYRVALMVSDLEGAALGGAAVWIDSELMEDRSAATFTPLGAGFPSDWHGWPANYVSPVLYTRIDFEGDVDHVEIIVSKTGYRVSRTAFDLGDVEGTYVFRAPVPLEPGL